MTTVLVPLRDADLAALAAGGRLEGVAAFAPTRGFLDTFGLESADDEDAERTLAYLAGLQALMAHGRRLVAVASAPVGGGDGLGAVTLASLSFGHVTALFADESEALPQVAAVRDAVAGISLGDAWDAPEHQALLEQADLLWYGPEEWATLVDPAH